MRRSVLVWLALGAALALGALVAGTTRAAAPAKRVALVVGNGRYQFAPALPSPAADARRWAVALKGAGFDVATCLECTRQQMIEQVRALDQRIAEGDEAFFYYSGHGAERDGVNLLFPVDFANTEGAGSAQQQAILLSYVVEHMARARVRVVVLDACRDWPFDDYVKGLGRPLFVSEETNSAGTLIAYATKYGAPATDSSAGSPFSDALLPLAFQRGKPLLLALSEAAQRVQERTGGVQVPWIAGNLSGDPYMLVRDTSPEDAWRNVTSMPDGPAKVVAAKAFINKYGQSGSPLVDVAWAWVQAQGGGGAPRAPLALGKVGDPPSGGPTGRTYVAQKGTAGEMSFIGLSEGVFDMGSSRRAGADDEHPLHRVRVSGFAVGQSEVTQAQWAAVVKAAQREGDADAPKLKLDPADFKGAQRPVEHVSWCDATRFANALSRLEHRRPAYTVGGGISCEQGDTVGWDHSADGYRLPTEAEWEYAARAGTGTAYFFGDDPGRLCSYANVFDKSGKKAHPEYTFTTIADCDDGQQETVPVCSYARSTWGLCDMIGNVWEWTWDFYDSGWYSQSSAADPTGPAPHDLGRVLRGGSAFDSPEDARSANRDWDLPSANLRLLPVGLRLVLPVPAAER